MSSEDNLKERVELHCEKNEVNGRRRQECNENCNHFQHGERGDDDDVASGYFMFQNDEEMIEILNKILKNNKISSETKRSCANKLYEVTKKMQFRENEDTLSSKKSNEKVNFAGNKKEKLGQKRNEIGTAVNTNVNSFSKKNQKLGFNNNAEGKPSKKYKLLTSSTIGKSNSESEEQTTETKSETKTESEEDSDWEIVSGEGSRVELEGQSTSDSETEEETAVRLKLEQAAREQCRKYDKPPFYRYPKDYQ